MTTPLTYNLTLPSDIFVLPALSASVSVCLSAGTCVDDDGERLRYGVLSLCLSAGEQRRGDGVPALRRSALSVAGGAQPPLDVPPNGSRERGRGRRPCGLSATRCRVPRAPRGYAAVRDWRLTPQLRAPRAPRRHALALKAKLQRLARAERRAAASDARASQATRRQPVSRFRSTQVRTVRQ